MKRLAIALILVAAVPAVVTASSDVIHEITGKNEVVSESMPSISASDRLISSKSSRPQLHRNLASAVEQPLETTISSNWQ